MLFCDLVGFTSRAEHLDVEDVRGLLAPYYRRLLDLHVRIGITTGEALVTLDARPVEGEGMASGDVVNTAARLQAAAPVDGVLVDATTRQAADRAIGFEEAEPVAAKGKAEPVAVWLALGPRSSLGVDVAPAPSTPLVGRDHELGQLCDALARIRRGQSQLLTLVGCPASARAAWSPSC